MSRRALALLTAVATVFGASAGHSAPPENCPLLSDPTGDANENPFIAGPGMGLPVPSVAGGDIVSGDLVAGSRGLTVVIRIAELDGPNDESPTGYLYSMQMDVREHRIDFTGVDNLDGQRFHVNPVQTGVSQSVHDGVSGVVDRASGEVRITATWDALADVTGENVRGHSASSFYGTTYRYVGNDTTGGVTPMLDRARSDRVYHFDRSSCVRQ